MTFIEDLEKCSWGDVYSERDVNSARSKWKELFLSVLNKRAPICHKVLRGIICPWLTSATKKLMNERDSFLRKARKTGSEVDWSTYRRLRNQVSNRIKIEKRRYQRNEIQNDLANPKSFWRALKSIFPNKERKSSTVQSIITDEGETITSKSTIVDKIKHLFHEHCVQAPGIRSINCHAWSLFGYRSHCDISRKLIAQYWNCSM